MADVSASETLAALHEARAAAARRVDDLEREARESVAAAEQASAMLVEHERVGGSATKRRELEASLARARERAAEPWPERVAGARQAVHDASTQMQAFIGEHLVELVAVHEAEAEAAVAEMVEACRALVSAYRRREAASQMIGTLASTVGRVHPSDVGPSTRCDGLLREANRLLLEGEPVPRLRHDPREPRHAASLPEAAAAHL
jgi:kynureninase